MTAALQLQDCHICLGYGSSRPARAAGRPKASAAFVVEWVLFFTGQALIGFRRRHA
jgi:hypothetical protein